MGLAVPGILWVIGVVALFFCPQVRSHLQQQLDSAGYDLHHIVAASIYATSTERDAVTLHSFR